MEQRERASDDQGLHLRLRPYASDMAGLGSDSIRASMTSSSTRHFGNGHHRPHPGPHKPGFGGTKSHMGR